MLHISLKTEKYFIAHPWRLLCVVGFEEYSAHDWRAVTSGTARSSYLARVGPVVERILHKLVTKGEPKGLKHIVNSMLIQQNQSSQRAQTLAKAECFRGPKCVAHGETWRNI